MTTGMLPPRTTSSPATFTGRTAPEPPHRRRGRAGVVAVMVVALLASAGARYLTDTTRQRDIPHSGEASATTSLSNMDSFALGLLLGGLRGPLVMFLWTQSESQKSAKNLEGFDTQIEWIRLLQPEFDTVHIFQIWNKAYNISVQMASLANKYAVILDALDYAHNVDREKPDDINILTAIGQIYFDKLGNSSEKLYYRKRVRAETLPHPVIGHQGDPGWRRTKLDPMLDDHFNLLPALIAPAPGRARPANLPADKEWDDGAELQYLPAWQPFPDGISPFALAYNYYKRSEVLQNTYQQRHAQMSDVVIDSRPALALKNWSMEEWEQGRRRAAQAFGLADPDDRNELEQTTVGISPTQPVENRQDAELAIFAYQRSADLVPAAVAEYQRHMAFDPDQADIYTSHIAEAQASRELCLGDKDYLQAVLADPAQKPALLKSAAGHYQQAADLYAKLVLLYYTDPNYLQAALPKGYGRVHTGTTLGVADLTPQQAAQVYLRVTQIRGRQYDSHMEDLQEYNGYFHRIAVRLQLIHAALAQG